VVLEYLDRLCAALVAREDDEVRRLLEHELARRLPRACVEEALAIIALPPESFRAPMKTLWFRHATERLTDAESRSAAEAQLNLPFLPPLA
jgi:hypothetical protein